MQLIASMRRRFNLLIIRTEITVVTKLDRDGIIDSQIEVCSSLLPDSSIIVAAYCLNDGSHSSYVRKVDENSKF